MPTQNKRTTLDSDTTKPSQTVPGDGPADTTDPNERAVSAPVRPGEEAVKVGTVNAVVAAEPVREQERDGGNDRTETYEVTAPDGSRVTVTRNVETGESKVK